MTEAIRYERVGDIAVLAVDNPATGDPDTLLPAQCFEILERAEPDVRGVIPFIR